MEWSKKFSVGVKEFDDQHKQLIAMINKLNDACGERCTLDIQKNILTEIVNYVKTHFETEEKYMRMFNFPGYNEHHSEHEKFIQKAVGLQMNSVAFGFVSTLEIVNLLRQLLEDHLLKVDMNYVDFFHEKGMK
jgi:hemerythrin